MQKKKIDSILYIIKVFIIQPIVIIGLALLINYLICVNKNAIDLVNTGLVNLNSEGLMGLKENQRILLFIIIVYFAFVYIHRRFLTFGGQIISDYPMIVYWLALLFGYRNISVKYMPIPKQFQLYSSSIMRYIKIDYKYIDDNNVVIKHIVEKNDSSQCHETNILIGDTYSIKINDIVNIKKNNYTIIINRDLKNINQGTRCVDIELINILQKEVNIIKDQCHVFNLFCYTNPKNTRLIYDKVFHTINDEYLLNVYYNDNQFKFVDKKISINC